MTEIGLTQEQIDSILGDGGAAEEQAAPDLSVLADFERQTMGNLPSVLNAMTGTEYEMVGVEFAVVGSEELPALIGNDLIFGLPTDLGERLTHCLIVESGFAKQVAAVLTGGEVAEDAALNEMEVSAIQEVVSQVNGTYLTNLSSSLQLSVSGELVSRLDMEAATELIKDSALLGTITLGGGDEPVLIRHMIPTVLGRLIVAKVSTAGEPPAPAAEATKLPDEPAEATEPPLAAEPVPAAPAAAVQPEQPVAKPAEQTVPPVSSGSVMGPTTEFSPAAFSQLLAPDKQLDARNLDILLDVPLQVTVELGKTTIPIRQILEYGQGSLITLDKLAGEPIDLLVNGKYFAKGEVVVIDENFGVRITSILSPAERIAQLG